MATSNSLPLGEAFQPYAATVGEDYMNPTQLEHFRRLLLLWRRNLLEEAGRTLTHMKDATAIHPDPNDRATQEEEFSLALRTRDRERKLLSKISQALARIDAQDYGYCKSCGEAIGLRRLEARPTATLCIDCKTAEEIREKQAGR
jgi:DnaK suppressor protein